MLSLDEWRVHIARTNVREKAQSLTDRHVQRFVATADGCGNRTLQQNFIDGEKGIFLKILVIILPRVLRIESQDEGAMPEEWP